VALDKQQIRSKSIKSLEGLFDLACSLAKGEIKTQVVAGKQLKVTVKQRQMWARIAAYTAQIMNSVMTGFDEKQIDTQLDELEKLVNEAKAKREDKGDRGAGEKPSPG
jgi:hypothetical protein